MCLEFLLNGILYWAKYSISDILLTTLGGVLSVWLVHLKLKIQTITQTIMIKITRMIRFFLLQFMHVADGDLIAKFSGAFKISLAEKY